MLKGKYEEAVRLIMQPHAGEKEDSAAARALYLEKGESWMILLILVQQNLQTQMLREGLNVLESLQDQACTVSDYAQVD